MSEWYAKRLAEMQGRPQTQPAPAVQAPQYPPTAPVPNTQLPQHLAPYATPQQLNAPGHYAPQPGQVPQAFHSYNAETGAQTADDGHVELLYHAVADTGGSTIVKANTSVCPNCGGTMYARIHAENGMLLRTPAMPQCGDCNYPVVQSGSQGGAIKQSTRADGPPRRARQLPSNHRVTVMTEAGMQTFDPPTGA